MRFPFFIAIIFLSLQGHADLAEELVKCANIGNQAERVACYDRVTDTVKAAPKPSPGPRQPDTPAAGESPEPPVTAKEPAQPAQKQNPVKVDNFGAERLADENRREDPPAPDKITATITDVSKLIWGEHQLTLDNGQVWRENEVAVRVDYKIGDTVTISEGTFSSYRLKSHRTGMINRVHRVK